METAYHLETKFRSDLLQRIGWTIGISSHHFKFNKSKYPRHNNHTPFIKGWNGFIAICRGKEFFISIVSVNTVCGPTADIISCSKKEAIQVTYIKKNYDEQGIKGLKERSRSKINADSNTFTSGQTILIDMAGMDKGGCRSSGTAIPGVWSFNPLAAQG